VEPAQVIRRSVFDRLLADDAAPSADRELIDSVRDSLHQLFNTRRRLLSSSSFLPDEELVTSELLPFYGIPDFTRLSLTDANALKHFQEAVSLAIRHNEPRFTNVKVEIGDQKPQASMRTLTIIIQGKIMIDPNEPKDLQCEISLDRVKHQVAVSGSLV
jgi:type VI secretion system lysozyme-like protein